MGVFDTNGFALSINGNAEVSCGARDARANKEMAVSTDPVHLACVLGPKSLSVFVDGHRRDSVVLREPIDLIFVPGPWRIGGNRSGDKVDEAPFFGCIGRIRLWNQAFSDPQVCRARQSRDY